MLRIGKLTGKIYDETVKPSSIGECCITITRKEDLDKELKRWEMDKLSDDCCFCRGCPEYQIET